MGYGGRSLCSSPLMSGTKDGVTGESHGENLKALPGWFKSLFFYHCPKNITSGDNAYETDSLEARRLAGHGLASTSIVVGITATDRHGTVAQSSYLDLQAQSRESQLGMACGFETSKPASHRATPTNSSQTVLPTRDQAFKPMSLQGTVSFKCHTNLHYIGINKEICGILKSYDSPPPNFMCPSPVSEGGVCR